MSSFHKAKEIKNPTVGSKVMTSGSALTHFSQFSQYLNHFNSDFDPWIVIGMIIWLYSQWHWFQLFFTDGSKLEFLGPTRVNSLSNLVKVAENLQGAWVWYKTMKNVVFLRILTFFLPLVNPGLTTSILVILAEKGTLGAPMFEWVAPRHSGCPHGPMERKWYFWIFRGRHANWG